jgi:hypothetical protein
MAKKPEWVNGNHQRLNTLSKTFNRQVGCIAKANCIDNVFTGLAVRSWWDKGKGLVDYPENKRESGYLFQFDMQNWTNLPQSVYKVVKELCMDKKDYPNGILFYEFHHWNGDSKILHGYVVTTLWDEGCKLIRYWNWGKKWEVSESVLLECIQYITDGVPVLKPFPNYGDLLTLQEFKDDCASGGFIDYDGFGNMSTKEGMSDFVIRPSMLKDKTFVIPEWVTHVEWFNR